VEYKRKFMIPSRQLVDHHMATNWGAIAWPAYQDQSYAGPCVAPDIALFRSYFPEFVDIPDARIQLMIDEAACSIDDSWAHNCAMADCTLAILYLAAHLLTMLLFAASALPQTDSSGGGVISGGEVTGVSFETMKVTYSASQMQVEKGGSKESVYSYESTPYGQRYLDLLKVNFPAILIV
jgi:hypothetical protein